MSRIEIERAIEEHLGRGEVAATQRGLAQQSVDGGRLGAVAQGEREVALRLVDPVQGHQRARPVDAQLRAIAPLAQGARAVRDSGPVFAFGEQLLGDPDGLAQSVVALKGTGHEHQSNAPCAARVSISAGLGSMGAVRYGSRGLRLVLFVSLALCGSARLARAQEEAPATETRRRASEHVQRGDAFKESGDYAAAAREYQKAYALVPHPVLFFNLAQVYRLAGDRERAIEHYERYLAADPNGRASRQARQFAAELRRELERERAGRRESSRSRAGAGPDSAPSGTTALSRSAQRPSPGRGLRLAGMVSAGAGLIAIGVGVKFGLDARGISDDIDAHAQGEWPEELLARQADGKSAERNMFVLTGAGAAAIAAGGVLYYFGHRARRESAPAAYVTPVAGGGLGLVFSGKF